MVVIVDNKNKNMEQITFRCMIPCCLCTFASESPIGRRQRWRILRFGCSKSHSRTVSVLLCPGNVFLEAVSLGGWINRNRLERDRANKVDDSKLWNQLSKWRFGTCCSCAQQRCLGAETILGSCFFCNVFWPQAFAEYNIQNCISHPWSPLKQRHGDPRKLSTWGLCDDLLNSSIFVSLFHVETSTPCSLVLILHYRAIKVFRPLLNITEKIITQPRQKRQVFLTARETISHHFLCQKVWDKSGTQFSNSKVFHEWINCSFTHIQSVRESSSCYSAIVSDSIRLHSLTSNSHFFLS